MECKPNSGLIDLEEKDTKLMGIVFDIQKIKYIMALKTKKMVDK